MKNTADHLGLYLVLDLTALLLTVFFVIRVAAFALAVLLQFEPLSAAHFFLYAVVTVVAGVALEPDVFAGHETKLVENADKLGFWTSTASSQFA